MASRILRKAVEFGRKNFNIGTRYCNDRRTDLKPHITRSPVLYGFVILGSAWLSYAYYWSNYPRAQLPHDPKKKNLVIIGTGWGGTTLIENLNTEDYNVTVVSPKEYFIYTPLLPSFTVGEVSLASIVVSIRDILAHKKRMVKYVNAICTDIDPKKQKITIEGPDGSLSHGDGIKYDYLVISAGTKPSSMGIPGFHEYAIPIRDPSHARSIKDRINHSLEMASSMNLPPEEVDQLLSVVITGGGPTGVEMASVIHNYINKEVEKWHPHLVGKPKVLVIEAHDKVLPSLSLDASNAAAKYLNDKGITILTGTLINGATRNVVVTESADNTIRKIAFGTLITAMGEVPNALVANLLDKVNDPRQDRCTGLRIDDHLRVMGLDKVYAIGDNSISNYPSTAQVASQQGKYLASHFRKLAVLDEEKKTISDSGMDENSIRNSLLPPFNFKNKGVIVSFGSPFAIAQFPNNFVISNQLCYMLWKLVILYNMKAFSCRISYITDNIRNMVFKTTLP